MNGKGDRDRTADRKKFNESYDRIFGDKAKRDRKTPPQTHGQKPHQAATQ